MARIPEWGTCLDIPHNKLVQVYRMGSTLATPTRAKFAYFGLGGARVAVVELARAAMPQLTAYAVLRCEHGRRPGRRGTWISGSLDRSRSGTSVNKSLSARASSAHC